MEKANVKVYTTYYSKIKQIREELNDDCVFLGISQTVPKWLDLEENKIIHTRELAPDFKWMKETGYKFREKMVEKLDKTGRDMIDTYIGLVSAIFGTGNIFLVCWEKEREKCHRKIVAEYLKPLYGEIKEWS